VIGRILDSSYSGKPLARERTWDAMAQVGPALGVYEIRSVNGELIAVGYAGSASPWGLVGELSSWRDALGSERTRFGVEVTSSYLSRYIELQVFHLREGRRPAVRRGSTFTVYTETPTPDTHDGYVTFGAHRGI
jgi:hypothetical protein